MENGYFVKLDAFEGPLDLLLHLIQKYEIDIYDIPMAELTKQYMEYVHTMQKLELNIVSEYLVMAATLLAIKSQMLLPNQEMDDESDEYEEDPRQELMERLIEYRKYKEAAQKLKEKEFEANQIFTRPPVQWEKEKAQVMEQGDISIYDMIHALSKIFERKKWNLPLHTKVKRADISIEQRMNEVRQIVRESKEGIAFDQLFPNPSKSEIVTTFIAILELMKAKEIYCKQKHHFDTLMIYYMGE